MDNLWIFSSSPLGTQRLLRLHRLILRLEAKVLDINTKAIIKPFQEAVRQGVFLFLWGQKKRSNGRQQQFLYQGEGIKHILETSFNIMLSSTQPAVTTSSVINIYLDINLFFLIFQQLLLNVEHRLTQKTYEMWARFCSSPVLLTAGGGGCVGGTLGDWEGESSRLWSDQQKPVSEGFKPQEQAALFVKTSSLNTILIKITTWISRCRWSSAPTRCFCCAPSPAPVSVNPRWTPP